MKRILLFCGLLLSFNVYSQNLQLMANLSYGNSALANIGGYVDTLGNEYALVGTDFGLDIVDVTIPTNPLVKFTVNDATSDWREVKTYQKYAYVTTEGGGGLTIIDLSLLPASINTTHYFGDGAIAGQLIASMHCIVIQLPDFFICMEVISVMAILCFLTCRIHGILYMPDNMHSPVVASLHMFTMDLLIMIPSTKHTSIQDFLLSLMYGTNRILCCWQLNPLPHPSRTTPG